MGIAAGSRIGRYVVTRELGAGGMAVAYLAQHVGAAGFVKLVVVKVLHDAFARDQGHLELFLREGRVGARLSHTNLMQVLDIGEDDGRHFIVMEYVDGLTLQQTALRCWAAGEDLPIDVALRVMMDAARGLDYAHTFVDQAGVRAPVIHRDISPDNLIIAREGTVKELDFGVAKATGADATRGGVARGKIPFMSPEQLEGEVDARTDLWALGVTLYWCLTRRLPFNGKTDIALMQAIASTDPQPLASLRAGVSPEVSGLVARLLERDRGRRVGSAAELVELLAEVTPPARVNPVAAFVARMRAIDPASMKQPRARDGARLTEAQEVASTQAPVTGSGVFASADSTVPMAVWQAPASTSSEDGDMPSSTTAPSVEVTAPTLVVPGGAGAFARRASEAATVVVPGGTPAVARRESDEASADETVQDGTLPAYRLARQRRAVGVIAGAVALLCVVLVALLLALRD
jgi:serine/threonine-protein kinase